MAETTSSPSTDAADEAGLRVIQRTIMRPELELDVRPLYLEGVSSFGGGAAQDSGGEASWFRRAAKVDSSREALSASGFATATAEGGVRVKPERRVSFGTYFNAFPASYWRRWTVVESVRLSMTVHGQGSVIVYRSTARGTVLRVDAAHVDAADGETLTFDLTLKPFIDGGYYWFDAEAGDTELTVERAQWSTVTDRTSQGTVTIGITTFNRPTFCVDQLVNLSGNPGLLELVDEILVVDQGTQRVVDDPRHASVAAALGDRLRIIEQPNLGGSGGFSRAMDEASSRGASDYVLLLDDDVVCELESIHRAVAFADLSKRPSVVGGQMFSLYDRTVLHAFGETVAKHYWRWGPAPETTHNHDFARRSLRSTGWLHRRVDVDYNGWWMCLIPTSVIREIGLSMPMFIKWDDAEFGLRAAAAGHPTVTLPGVAVWHVPWTEKDDTIDWQAYFHLRNRILSALLHSPHPHGGGLVAHSLAAHTKHAMSMQYSPAEMILMAISDVLDGPERLHRDLAHRLGEVLEMRKAYTDAQMAGSIDDFPVPRGGTSGRGVVTPTGLGGKARAAVAGLVHQARPVDPLSREHPETLIPHVDQKWWRFMQHDSALVSSADGTSVSWYKRDPEELRQQLRRSARLHSRLYREWDQLAARYRSALHDVTSPETWKQAFDGAGQAAGESGGTSGTGGADRRES